jgi:ABC-type glycerol-3-phosphate transport system permease component
VTAESTVTTDVDRPEPAPPGTVVTPADGGTPARTVRRAKVAVTRIDPWSVMKISFALWVALAIVLLIATAILWWVLDSSGVFDQVSQSILKVTGTDNGSGNLTDTSFQLKDFISFGRVMGVTTILAVINTILLTALSTLAAFLFNLSAGLVGGVDITLTETD